MFLKICIKPRNPLKKQRIAYLLKPVSKTFLRGDEEVTDIYMYILYFAKVKKVQKAFCRKRVLIMRSMIAAITLAYQTQTTRRSSCQAYQSTFATRGYRGT